MREHICIRRPEYVAGTVERPEVGVFTQAATAKRPSPWGKVASGEKVWMKWTGGPIVATAEVAGYREFMDCSPEQLRDAVQGFELHGLEAYWESLDGPLCALVIFLCKEAWLDEPIDVSGRSYGSSWLVLPDQLSARKWMAAPPAAPKGTKDPRGPRVAGKKLRFLVFRRDSYTCQYCGRRAPNVGPHCALVQRWQDRD